MKSFLFATVSLLAFSEVFSFYEASLTEGQAIVANDTKFINFDNLKVKTVNKTHHLLIGTIDVLRDIDNSFKLESLFYKRTGNAYQKSAMHLRPIPACDYIKHID